MNEPGGLALGFAAGGAFGAVYLALIWAAARRIAGPRPALPFAALAAARAALLLGVLFGAVALGADAATLLAGLAGFVVLRVAVTSRMRGPGRRTAWK